ncbi:MAG: diphthine--ammonia ligase [Chloroflexota bacterium]|nr:diphthine--ammonia ligase [Candidatus Sulfotelmatobacter sp.]
MKLGILFSGGKDSTLALHIATKHEKVACLITLASTNKESYMFHTPNIDLTKLQAEALEIPLITKTTAGKKEKELKDLEQAITEAIEEYQIEGIVTGAVESVYQSSRIQRICQHLDLWCFNPLWKRDQRQLLEEILQQHFNVLISGIFAYPLDEGWLGKEIDLGIVKRLIELEKEFGISPSGEGGEIETTVLDAPLFKKKLEVLTYSVEARGNSGVFNITEGRLVPK